jgi:hypothetical protein
VSCGVFLHAYIDNLSKKINLPCNNDSCDWGIPSFFTGSAMHEHRNLCPRVILVIVVVTALQSRAQESIDILLESFDSIVPPALPAGWRSSQRRSAGMNDWGTTSSTTYSPPGAVLVTNATLEQYLATPTIDCRGKTPNRVRMIVRRSGTFTALVTVELSLDSGVTFPMSLGTIGKETGNGVYQPAEFAVSETAAGQGAVVLRWRILPEATGASGTFRMDDIRLTLGGSDGAHADSVIINEIMFTPRSGEPEWIELLNIGHANTDLRGWSLSDAATTARHGIAGNSVIVSPEEYVILTSDTAALFGSRPGIRARCLQTDGFPSLNNGGDFVHLFTRSGGCADSVEYHASWGGAAGVSLERIDSKGPSNEGGNWTSSVDSAGATPGTTNSTARRACDLAAVRMLFPGRCTLEICDVSLTIRNVGRNPAPSWSILLCDDVNRDSVADDGEVIGRMSGTETIAPGDSVTCAVEWVAPVPGKHCLRAQVILEGDERQSNNGVSAVVLIPCLPGSVRINEIMYEPLSGMPEFVELVNASVSAIDLEDCALCDRPTSGGTMNVWKLRGRAFRLPGGRYMALVADSSGMTWFPSLRAADPGLVVSMHASGLGLNNEGDALVLRSAGGVVLDSVAYAPSFHTPDITDTKGRSLELISPALDGISGKNWGTCVDPSGGTPAARNSITVAVFPSHATLLASPNPFSPDGDGVDDVAVLSYSLPVRSSLIRVRVYDVRGRPLRELANIIPSGTEGHLVWDGRDDQGRRARIGVYIAILEAIDGAGGMTFAAKCVVILAARL